MPLPVDSEVELSLRHLPDISDASFSFQIPAVAKGDLLLADDDTFLQDAITTPGPSRTPYVPFTLSELTPKPIRRHDPSSVPSSPSLSLDRPVKSERKKRSPDDVRAFAEKRSAAGLSNDPSWQRPRLVARSQGCETLPIAAKLETLRAEVETLNSNICTGAHNASHDVISARQHDAGTTQHAKEQPQDRTRDRAVAKTRRTVISGGISKVRGKNISSASSFARKAALTARTQPRRPVESEPRHPAPSKSMESDEHLNSDSSMYSTVNGGVAERLVMYSQNLISSFELLNSGNQSTREIGTKARQSEVALENDNDKPLTLSQLSPHKPAPPTPLPMAAGSISPMRTSRKRPVSAASGRRTKKKGKPTVATVPKHAAGGPALEPAAGRHDLVIDSTSGSGSGCIAHTTTKAMEGAMKGMTTRQVQITKLGNKESMPVRAGWNDNLGSGSGSTSLGFSDKDNPTMESSVTLKAEGACSNNTGVQHMPRHDMRVVLPPVNPTKPIGFRFQLEARMEARKAEHEKERSVKSQKRQKHHHHPLPVPDFKTLHAMQEAELAQRKENIQPVVSFPLELNTDSRAREREKFDEQMRVKEREVEEAMERRRKAREENEEREVRELRKKAVPRAHVVPEWYNEAPKRKARDME